MLVCFVGSVLADAGKVRVHHVAWCGGMSDGAWAGEPVNLELSSHDNQCSHGSTCGKNNSWSRETVAVDVTGARGRPGVSDVIRCCTARFADLHLDTVAGAVQMTAECIIHWLCTRLGRRDEDCWRSTGLHIIKSSHCIKHTSTSWRDHRSTTSLQDTCKQPIALLSYQSSKSLRPGLIIKPQERTHSRLNHILIVVSLYASGHHQLTRSCVQLNMVRMKKKNTLVQVIQDTSMPLLPWTSCGRHVSSCFVPGGR